LKFQKARKKLSLLQEKSHFTLLHTNVFISSSNFFHFWFGFAKKQLKLEKENEMKWKCLVKRADRGGGVTKKGNERIINFIPTTSIYILNRMSNSF
jgi:hypothetical protein